MWLPYGVFFYLKNNLEQNCLRNGSTIAGLNGSLKDFAVWNLLELCVAGGYDAWVGVVAGPGAGGQKGGPLGPRQRPRRRPLHHRCLRLPRLRSILLRQEWMVLRALQELHGKVWKLTNHFPKKSVLHFFEALLNLGEKDSILWQFSGPLNALTSNWNWRPRTFRTLWEMVG